MNCYGKTLVSRMLLSLFLGGLLASTAWAQPGEPLTLRLNDAEARPGELAAVVVRTYAPRGVGQGQLCMGAFQLLQAPGVPVTRGAEGLASPWVALENVIVFSGEDDATSDASFDPTTQTAVLDFESLSGTINSTDGPLAVLYFRVAEDAVPGSVFEVQLDLGDTFLVDPTGQPIRLELRSGELEILAPTDPFSVLAEGDRIAPGGVAQLGVASAEFWRLGQGQVTFLYDPAVASGAPVVTLDPRHGSSMATVDVTTPGRVVVDFTSADGSLNTVPGQWISIGLPTRPDVPLGTLSAVAIDPVTTAIVDDNGAPLALSFDSDVVEFVAAEPLFADDFESGDLREWSQTMP